jgi:putative sterol carrier protein
MASFSTAEEMKPVVAKWLDLMSKDSQMAAKCKGINVSMQFIIIEPDVNFYTSFMDGTVTCGLGSMEPKAMVDLEMSSATLDGMMTGELDGAGAAMSGDLSFSGDMSAAMGLQALQEDMIRLYLQSK